MVKLAINYIKADLPMKFRSIFLALSALSLTPAVATEKKAPQEISYLKGLSNEFKKVAKEASPAVVFIEVQTAQSTENQLDSWNLPSNEPSAEDPLEKFFGHSLKPQQPRAQASSQGSGFFVSPDGYILTNNHVVKDAIKVIVRTPDQKEYPAQVIGTDRSSDMALLKVEGKNLPYLKFADPENVEVGEWAIAIGSPFALSSTFTVGIVSAKGRSSLHIADYEDFIQTDAAINPGNSGGPLIDLDGNVIGINTAIVSKSGGYNGIGFAIPVNLVKFVMEQLKENGKVTRGFLGVRLQDIDYEMASCFKLNKVEGALVSEVEIDSPAALSGMKLGDIVIEYNGKTVTDFGKLRNEISMTKPGETVTIKVLRDGGNLVTLTPVVGSANLHAQSIQGMMKKIGFKVTDLSKEIKTKMTAQMGEVAQGIKGCYVSSLAIGSHAQHRGMHVGMVIDEVNRVPVANSAEFNKAIKTYFEEIAACKDKKKPPLLLRVFSAKEGKNGPAYLTLPAP